MFYQRIKSLSKKTQELYNRKLKISIKEKQKLLMYLNLVLEKLEQINLEYKSNLLNLLTLLPKKKKDKEKENTEFLELIRKYQNEAKNG